jgi:hypothetical protein
VQWKQPSVRHPCHPILRSMLVNLS